MVVLCSAAGAAELCQTVLFANEAAQQCYTRVRVPPDLEPVTVQEPQSKPSSAEFVVRIVKERLKYVRCIAAYGYQLG
jgi:hypothetical protein